jgi:dephospho-CoA kinase
VITVGLTGGIACGKSTVAGILRAQGVPVLDLDQVAREVVAPGSPALAEIAQRWPTVVRDGVLDRKTLGAIVFADPEARRTLEAITHPRVWEASERWLAERRAEGHPAAFVEAALMVETGSWRRYDRLIVVSCAPEVQLARVMARDGLTRAEAEARIRAQMAMAEKERVASVVVRNDGDPDDLRARVATGWPRWVGTPPT